MPSTHFNYQATRQPIVMEWWNTAGDPTVVEMLDDMGRYSTIASWQQTEKDIEWQGQKLRWSKHINFEKFIELPALCGQAFELALSGCNAESEKRLKNNQWHVTDAVSLSLNMHKYREYISKSRAEFTVAKEQYVSLNTGWFSDRSASYLAAGRPVITQETGFSKFLPTGKGLFGFRTMEGVLAAIETIESDYEGNCHAAREIANEYFAAEKVVGSLMQRAGL